MRPAQPKWWDDAISSYVAPYYASAEEAAAAVEEESGGRFKVKKGKVKGHFIWGDRVRVLSNDPATDDIVKVAGRASEVFIRSRHLGGAALLELYVIDVGQGDGLLAVTPEGHHIMIDGGNVRKNQNGGKNAADFVDWKFIKDYLSASDRKKPEKRVIRLDAMIASHNDIDHFGGLSDLLNFSKPENKSELDASEVRVDNFYHAGLSWWTTINSKGKKDRTLGATAGYYDRLIGDRASCEKATRKLASPDKNTLSGAWGVCIRGAVECMQASVPGAPTNIERLSHGTHEFLPGFGPSEPNSSVTIRVLGPIAEGSAAKPKLKVFPDGDSKNTNGHSIVLRLDYGKRRLLLTGDLNTHAQHYIMNNYGTDFGREFSCDVAKGCHHGSNDVSYSFLLGMKPVATVISSGDAEDYDHPRPAIVAASAITGRKLLSEDGDTLISPLVFMTEVARSYRLAEIEELHEYDERQAPHQGERPSGAVNKFASVEDKSHFRAMLAKSPSKPKDWPRLDQVVAVRDLVYGLVNVRTDGETLFFAALEEEGPNWATHILTDDDIAQAELGM